ncbi:MAG: STAS domain-containing protein [Spirochaetes bacterium]|nr:STAS domain-containing protein [Spirochaetota bacterium]
MEIKHTINNNVGILHLVGQFAYGDEKRISDIATEILQQPLSVLAIDVSRVENINSIGVASLFSVLKIVDEYGVDFVIYGAKANVSLILDKVFENDFVPILTEEEFTRRFLS